MNYLLLGLLQTFLQLLDSEMEGASVFAISLMNKRLMTRKSKSMPRETPELNKGSRKLSVEGKKKTNGCAGRCTSPQFLPHSQEERGREPRRCIAADPQR